MPKKTKPAAIAEMEVPGQPFSSCVQVDDHFYFPGTVPIVEDGRVKSDGDFEQQTSEVLQKMIELLTAAGLGPDDVVSATVMICSTKLDNPDRDYAFLNERWSIAFGPNPSGVKPRRKAFGVSWLPFGALIEIEFDAVRQSD